jgi:hypothetical protein
VLAWLVLAGVGLAAGTGVAVWLAGTGVGVAVIAIPGGNDGWWVGPVGRDVVGAADAVGAAALGVDALGAGAPVTGVGGAADLSWSLL